MAGNVLAKLSRGDGKKPPTLAPTQEHVPVALVRNGLVVSRAIAPAKAVPYRIVARVLRVGVVEITRMAQADRDSFLTRYAAVVAKWRFPYQIIVTRECQDLSAFYRRLETQAQRGGPARPAGGRRERELAEGLAGWMRRVTERVNPQVPAYYLVVPHPTTALDGPAYEKAVKTLDERTRMVINTLATLGVPASPVEDEELIRLLCEMYHPRLPDLSTSPRAQAISLMAEVQRPAVSRAEGAEASGSGKQGVGIRGIPHTS
jgi:hypothetical protein